MKLFWLLIFILGFSQPSWARKFALDKQSVAPYIRGNWGTAVFGRKVFENSSGGARFDPRMEVEYQYAGEFGVFFLMDKVGLRVGAQGIYPQSIDDVAATNSAGQHVFSMTSKVYGFFPVAHLEYAFYQSDAVRIYVSGGGGIGTVTFINDYRMTTAGTAYYGLADFTEEGRAYVGLVEGGAGYEFSLADNATMFIDFGYRGLNVETFSHNRDARTFGGQVLKGETVSVAGGGKRSIDMSSYYGGLGLKFYFNY